MADKLRWGILATGSIAKAFAKGVNTSATGELVAVGSRTIESATKFADEFGGKPYGSYEDLLADPAVDAVYIATPHHLHAEWTIQAAAAGKGVLCEKPFTLNAIEAEKAIAAVRKAGVFFMEAFMYRCHPQTLKLVELVRSGVVGRVENLNCEFGFHAPDDWGNFRADGAVGGGGLMDVGAYCVSFARLLLGEPDRCFYAARFTERGYDAQASGLMRFDGGATAHFGTGIHIDLKNDARVYGSEGWIQIDSPWTAGLGAKMTVYRKGREPETFVNDDERSLYAIEADAVARHWEAGECPFMSIEDTLGQMRTLDALRRSADFRFAAEPVA